jgi:hypothetical protein
MCEWRVSARFRRSKARAEKRRRARVIVTGVTGVCVCVCVCVAPRHGVDGVIDATRAESAGARDVDGGAGFANHGERGGELGAETAGDVVDACVGVGRCVC